MRDFSLHSELGFYVTIIRDRKIYREKLKRGRDCVASP